MADKLKKSDITYLKRHAGSKSVEELAQRFDTDAATVRAKMRELGLTDDDAAAMAADPVLPVFEKGIEAFHQGKLKAAIKHLEQVVEESEQMELTERARQYLAICRVKTGKADDGETEPYLQAVLLKNRGELDQALEIAESGKGDDGRYQYLAASIHSLGGRLDQARAALEKAIERDPKHRVYAFHDPDFAALRQDDAHSSLFEQG